MGMTAADYKIEISDDRMTASISLLNKELAGSLTINGLKAALHEAGITSGLVLEQLENLTSSPIFGEFVIVARGKQPPSKTISEVTYMFDTGNPSQQCNSDDDGDCRIEKEAPEEHGRIDLKSVQVFQNVREGAILAKRTVITPEMCGTDVCGNSIEPEFSKASAPKSGRGTDLDEQTGTITATLTGHATLVGGKVTVVDTLDIKSDVDYSVGNIDFIGNVKVMGSIHPGFRIRCGSNLTISGNVDRALLECGGDLTINGIVFGAGETVIRVEGDAKVDALDQCRVYVRGNLDVANYMRHCTAHVGGNLKLESKKGGLVGGEVHVYHNVDVTSLGSRMAALTRLTVGRNPFAEVNPDELRVQIQENEAKLKQVSLGIDNLRKRLAASNQDIALQQRLSKLLQAEAQFMPLLEGLRFQLEEAQRNAEYYREAVIRVRQVIYPGVIVNFRDKMQYKTMDSMKQMCFYEHEAEIKTRSL